MATGMQKFLKNMNGKDFEWLLTNVEPLAAVVKNDEEAMQVVQALSIALNYVDPHTLANIQMILNDAQKQEIVMRRATALTAKLQTIPVEKQSAVLLRHMLALITAQVITFYVTHKSDPSMTFSLGTPQIPLADGEQKFILAAAMLKLFKHSMAINEKFLATLWNELTPYSKGSANKTVSMFYLFAHRLFNKSKDFCLPDDRNRFWHQPSYSIAQSAFAFLFRRAVPAAQDMLGILDGKNVVYELGKLAEGMRRDQRLCNFLDMLIAKNIPMDKDTVFAVFNHLLFVYLVDMELETKGQSNQREKYLLVLQASLGTPRRGSKVPISEHTFYAKFIDYYDSQFERLKELDSKDFKTHKQSNRTTWVYPKKEAEYVPPYNPAGESINDDPPELNCRQKNCFIM